MSRIKLNHWYVKNNELSIYLMRFYTKIRILKNDQTIYYQLFVKGHDEKELIFNFYAIEDAISFTEQVINKSKNSSEVLEKYTLMFENDNFYLIEHLDYDGIKRDNMIMLTESDLKAALNHYINFYNYELIDFKYIGGIHRVGYFFDEDTPHYDGIQLEVKTKEKLKTLFKSPKKVEG